MVDISYTLKAASKNLGDIQETLFVLRNKSLAKSILKGMKEGYDEYANIDFLKK